MYHQRILELIAACQVAQQKGVSLDEMRSRILPDLTKPFLDSATDFLNWIKEDRQYSTFYYEVQESGVCAKPVEAAALILEAILIFFLEENQGQ
jgi:hypothetical protein